MVGCPLAAAAVSSCTVLGDRWIAPHLAVRTLFDCCRWTCSVAQVVQCTPLWPASWLPAVDKSRGSKSVEVQRVWEVMMSVFNLCLVMMPCCWILPLLLVMCPRLGLSGLVLLSLHLLMLICSVVVLFLVGGLVLGRGRASFRTVRLGGHNGS